MEEYLIQQAETHRDSRMKDFKQFQAQNRLQTFNEEGNLSGEHIRKEAIDFAIFPHLQIARLRFVEAVSASCFGVT